MLSSQIAAEKAEKKRKSVSPQANAASTAASARILNTNSNQETGRMLQGMIKAIRNDTSATKADASSTLLDRRASQAEPVLTVRNVNAAPINRQALPEQSRLNNIERRIAILEKRQKATQSDLKWRGNFGACLARHQEAVFRVSKGLDVAIQGFQSAQTAQAMTDALVTQLIGGAVAVAFAGGFEWMASPLLGYFGIQANNIKKTVELIENPTNAMVSSISSNISGVLDSMSSAQRGQIPNGGEGGNSAVGYLAEKSELLEKHKEQIENAFARRSEIMLEMTDEQMEQFDPSAQEKDYEQLLKDLEESGKGVESMKNPDEVSQILERQLWSLWLQRTLGGLVSDHEQLQEMGARSGSQMPEFSKYKPSEDLNIGSDIEAELIRCGVAAQARIKLSGHWYEPNSPLNWKELLSQWAQQYKETIYDEH